MLWPGIHSFDYLLSGEYEGLHTSQENGVREKRFGRTISVYSYMNRTYGRDTDELTVRESMDLNFNREQGCLPCTWDCVWGPIYGLRVMTLYFRNCFAYIVWCAGERSGAHCRLWIGSPTASCVFLRVTALTNNCKEVVLFPVSDGNATAWNLIWCFIFMSLSSAQGSTARGSLVTIEAAGETTTTAVFPPWEKSKTPPKGLKKS